MLLFGIIIPEGYYNEITSTSTAVHECSIPLAARIHTHTHTSPQTDAGLSGEKSKRFMMVGTKDNTPVGAKTGVVAPVPINTPSLRQETHGSQGDNAAMSSINRSSAGGWGSAAGVSSVPAGSATEQSASGGKTRGRVDGSSRTQGGDDVFTRHFPDLRAGLEQAEKLDAVSKASSKVAPLRKPKPEPSRGQGPSLRPRGTYAGHFRGFSIWSVEGGCGVAAAIRIVSVILLSGLHLYEFVSRVVLVTAAVPVTAVLGWRCWRQHLFVRRDTAWRNQYNI